MCAERHRHDDPDDDPPVAAAERVGVLRGAVVGPERADHLRPPPAKQRGVDHHVDHRIGGEQPGHDQPGQRQPEPVDVEGMVGEEPAHRVERHHRGHPSPGEHADHGATRGLCDQSGGQQSEQRERARPAKRGPERIQQRTPRLG